MKKLLFAMLMSYGCATSSTSALAIERDQGVRLVATERLLLCLGDETATPTTGYYRQECKVDSIRFCTELGLERTCGIDGVER